MSNHILCAVDESLEARRACAVAASLSAELELDTSLLHVLPEDHRFPNPASALTRHDSGPQRAGAERLLANAAEDHGLTPVTCDVVVGSPSQEILRAAEQQEPELIVVGSRGRGEMRSAILGSVSANLARNAPCPVVVISPSVEEVARSQGRDGAAVVCGVEAADHDAATLTLAGELAERLNGRLHAVHAHSEAPVAAGASPIAAGPPLAPAAIPAPATVAPAGEVGGSGEQVGGRGEKMLDEAISRAGVSAEPSVMCGDPAEVLDDAAKERGARLIVVGSHRRGRIAAAFAGSVSHRLASRSRTPVVVLPPRLTQPGG